MRVMLVAPYFPPEMTGSSNFVFDLALGLSEMGHAVCVVTATESRSHELFEVVSLKARRIKPGKIAFDYSIPTILTLANKRTLEDLFETFQPDIVSCHGQVFDITLLANHLARKRKIPTVMTVHSAIWHNKPILNAILTIGDLLISQLFLKRTCSGWIGVDNRTITHVEKRYSKHVSAVPICIRRGVFSGGDAQLARDKYGINGAPVIASIGHVVPVRNRIALVDAMPRLVEHFPNLEIVVVGRVADESFINRAEELGVTKHLRVIGAVPHSDIAHVLAASDLEVHDLQGYGLGIGSLEPIDAGVPIVAHVRDNNLPGVNLREICPDGFLLQNDAKTLSNAIVRAINDLEFREQLLKDQKKLLEDVYYSERVCSKYLHEFGKYLKN
jgi:glycosyltransferase involved in cell wall biosynthesis